MTTTPQHMRALTLANEHRLGVAAFKARVRDLPARAGAELIAYTIEHEYDSEILGALRTRHALLSVRSLGVEKMTRCLVFAGVPNFDRRLRELTPRQRKAVASQVRLWAAGYRG
jgi:hypothetical protein